MPASSSSPIFEESPTNGVVVKIGIVGAGPAGLVAARIMSRTIQQQQQQQQQQQKQQRLLSKKEQSLLPHFIVTIFEKGNDIGGVWKYHLETTTSDVVSSVPTTKTKKNHPMYRHLRTNLPKEIMAYREYPWTTVSLSLPTTETTTKQHLLETTITNETTAITVDTTSDNNNNNNISYVPHYNVYEYLHNYCQHFQLYDLIQYHCSVRQLTCSTTKRSYFSPKQSSHTATITNEDNDSDDGNDNDEIWPKIYLSWDQMNPTKFESSSPQTDTFDAIFICNGHYNVPSYPTNISGLDEHFKGTILHSIEYDIPDPFYNQTILCIGGRASGADIAREIANYHPSLVHETVQHNGYPTTTKVYLSDTLFPKPSSSTHSITQSNVTWVPKTICILPDGRVQFDSDQLEPIHVDTILLCTGYDYDFPFINNASNMHDFIGCDNRRVQLLYEQLWYVTAPNIVFIGIPHSIIPFPLFEFQCEAAVQSWFRSRHEQPAKAAAVAATETTAIFPTLPRKKIRIEKAMIDANSGGYGKENGRIPEDTHYLGPYQWDYCRIMAQYANIYNDTIENYIATNKAIWDHSGLERKGEAPGSPDLYRSTVYERSLTNPSSFRVVKSVLSSDVSDRP